MEKLVPEFSKKRAKPSALLSFCKQQSGKVSPLQQLRLKARVPTSKMSWRRAKKYRALHLSAWSFKSSLYQLNGSHFSLQIDQTPFDLVPVPLDKCSCNKTHQCKWQAMLEASARRSRNTWAWTLNLIEPEGGKSDGMPMESLQGLSSVPAAVLPLWSSNSPGFSILAVWPT